MAYQQWHFRLGLHADASMPITWCPMTVVDCREPCWDIESAKAQFAFVPDEVLREAVAGLPMALIWELET